MNVKSYTLLNKRGDKKYGLIHAVSRPPDSHMTVCGRPIGGKLDNWEETAEPVTCPRCLRKARKVNEYSQ